MCAKKIAEKIGQSKIKVEHYSGLKATLELFRQPARLLFLPASLPYIFVVVGEENGKRKIFSAGRHGGQEKVTKKANTLLKIL